MVLCCGSRSSAQQPAKASAPVAGAGFALKRVFSRGAVEQLDPALSAGSSAAATDDGRAAELLLAQEQLEAFQAQARAGLASLQKLKGAGADGADGGSGAAGGAAAPADAGGSGAEEASTSADIEEVDDESIAVRGRATSGWGTAGVLCLLS